MKELQNFLYKHMDALKHHKRYVAMLTALSLLVSFMVSLILIEPADSMTKQKLMLLSDTSNMTMVPNLNDGQDGNNGYSKGQLSEVTLLIGDGVEWAQGCLDADDVIEAAKREYFIGIASDFCVFLEGDLKPKGADAEGRVAVGGNITFTGDYNYQLGAGDYTTMTALINTDNYNGVTNFAHAIVGGYVKRINMLSTVGNGSLYYERPDASSLYQTGSGGSLTVYYPENEDLYKRIAIGNATAIDNCQHMTWLSSNNWAAKDETYNTYCEHDKFHPNELAQFYQADLIDFEAVFEWLKTQSQKLSNKTATGMSQVQDGVATFTGPGQDSDAVTIYFDLEQWDSDIREVRFIDVPENANLVVNCGGNIVKIGSEYGAVNFSTSINGEVISIIDSSGNVVNANNRKESEQILYNFYECGTDLSNLPTTDHGDEIVPYSLFVNTNFNGTILAPYAIVASDKECRGHLSGSLIAQKFTGGLEFGYRPYRGGTDILGSTAGYVVPFDKFVDDLNGNNSDNPRLAGATFEIKDENNNVVDTWTSTEETSYITFPTELDFTGGTTYTEDNDDVTHTYTISEKSAPEGYTTTAETYRVEVKETVDLGYLLTVDNGTIPTRATVEIKIFKNSDTVPVYSCKMIVEDTYSDNGIIQRIIAIDGSTKEYYVLNIESGNVTSVGSPTDPSVLDYIWTETANVEFDVQAMNVDGVDVLEDETDTSAENTEESTEEETTEEETTEEEITEEKKDPEIPNYLTATYGQKLSAISISNVDYGTWSWVNDDDDITVGDVGEKTFLANFKSNSNDYKSVENVAITVNVIKAQPAVNPVLNPSSDYTQGDTLPTITISDDDTAGTISWVNSTAKLKYGENVLEWEFTPGERNNYEEATGEITITASAIPTNLITLEKGEKTAQKLSDGKHYYDPTSLMIMPLPDETPSFINEYALVFKKQSDESTALAGATIELQSGTISNGEFNKSTSHGADSTPPWEWGNETNTYSIPLKKIQVKDLDTNVVYRFFEQTPPEGYEIAKPIYFVKTNNTTICYTDDETKLSDINSWTEIEFSESNKSSNIITMTDYKKYGPEIKLSKVQIGSSNPLQGAEFVLYAVDGDTLVYPLNDGTKLTSGSDGMIDFTKVFKANPDNCNSEYIKNGYLVPGEYYLEETKAPTDKYEAPTDKMYFVVNENYTVEAEKVEKPDATLITIKTKSDNNPNKIWYVCLDEKYLDNSSGASISNISSIEAKLKNSKQAKFYTNLQNEALTTTFDSATKITKAELNGENTVSKLEVQCVDWEDFQVEYVTITTADGTVYTSDLSIVGDTTPTAYTLTSDSIGLAVPSSGESIDVRPREGDRHQQWDAYLNNVKMDDNGPVIEKVKEIRVTADIAVKLYSKNYKTGDAINDKKGTYSNGITTIIFEEATDINKIEFQPESDWPVYTITKLEIETEDGKLYTTDSQSVGNTSSTGKPNIKITKLTAHYLNGDTKVVEAELNASDTVVDNAYPFDISQLADKESIIGLTLEVTGSGSEKINVKNVDGQIWSESVKFDNGATTATVTFGETNYTPPAAETGNSTLISVKDGTTDTLLVGNNKAGAITNISVEKKWSDLENLYNTRTDSITVQLKQDNSNYGEPVTLNAANGWKHTWTGIPRLKPNSESETYKYTVEEINAPTGYDVTYSNNSGIESGTITITNTLKTNEIPVEKKWVDSTGNPISEHPNSVTVKLQKHNGSGYSDFLDKNGNAVTLTLSSANSWSGKFTGIPEGTYQVVESVVPSGWEQKSNGNASNNYVITNEQKAGALKLTKIWQNDTADQRPQNITIKIYRTTTPPTNNNNNGSGGGTTGGGNNVDAMIPSATKSPKVTEDYARLLQYSLYFYDANMCGDEVTENSVIDWRNDCAVNYSTSAIQGGFHDAGDHIMYGLAQGFTASTLGWSYYEFGDAYDELGLTKHYKVIMDEFCEFFMNSVKRNNDGSISSLLVQKGDASEHNTWGPPEVAANHTSNETWVNDKGSEIAAQYAAALAQYVINFGDPGGYLDTAKALFDYSTKVNKEYWVKQYESGSIVDDQSMAAGWLYLATDIESYKTFCINNAQINEGWVYSWDEVHLGAACMKAHLTNDWSAVNDYLTNNSSYKCTDKNSYYFVNYWGSARYNALMQMIALVATKNSDSSYLDWSKYQMAYLLGNNPKNICYVTGFASNSAKYAHHRSASGYDSSGEKGSNVGYASDGHVLIGALVGGPSTRDGAYTDTIQDYNCNEVALDYNVGLVGAAAGLYYLSPSGHTVNADVMKADGLELKTGKTIYEEQPQAASINIEDIMNTSAMSFKRNAVSVLADEPYVLYASQISNGVEFDLPTPLLNKSLEKIVLNFDASSGSFGVEVKTNVGKNITISPSDQKVTSKTMTINAVEKENEEEKQFVNGYSSSDTIPCDTITSMKINAWGGCNLVSVEFHILQEGPSITITNAPTTALKIGVPHQLSASGVDSIGWRSSSEKVSVDNGNVTINKYPENGKVTITAYDTTNQDTKAEVTIDVEALSLTPPSSNVVIGDKVVYNANYDGFTINSGTGYSVNEKEVTATNTGNYTVSATYVGSSATASLNVSALQINGQTPLDVNGTYQFSVNGQTDGHTFEWISSDSTVLSFDANVPGLATTHKSGNVTIKVIKDGEYQSDEYDVAVQKGALSISVQPTQIRAGGTAELSAVNTEDDEVEYSCNSDFITISGNTITAGNVEIQETVEITGTLGQERATCNLTIIPLPTITETNNTTQLGIGRTLQLTANNILGTATWSSDDDSVLTVDENGLVTGVSTGTATITVTDTDGTTGTFKIIVKEIAVEPDIPDELLTYKQVTLSKDNLTSDGTWVITENLPLTDESGRKYYYYIEEVTDNGVVQGSGGKYIPISYSDNGFTLDENTEKEVCVTNKLTETIQGQLPSTGGSGVKTYYYFGGALMLLGIAGFTGLKRRERKRREE